MEHLLLYLQDTSLQRCEADGVVAAEEQRPIIRHRGLARVSGFGSIGFRV